MLPKYRKPTHPGIILFEEFLKPLILTARQFADLLGEGWTEKKVTAIINGTEPFSEKWADAFAEVLGTSPELWRNLHSIHRKWEAQQKQNEKGSLKPTKKAV
jgi:addiction module HigA family antidote